MISHNSRQMPRVSWKALLANSRRQEHHEAFGAWILSWQGTFFIFVSLVDFISGSLFLWHPVAKSVKAHGLPLDSVGSQGPWIPDDLRPHLDKWGPPLGMPMPQVNLTALQKQSSTAGSFKKDRVEFSVEPSRDASLLIFLVILIDFVWSCFFGCIMEKDAASHHGDLIRQCLIKNSSASGSRS